MYAYDHQLDPPTDAFAITNLTAHGTLKLGGTATALDYASPLVVNELQINQGSFWTNHGLSIPGGVAIAGYIHFISSPAAFGAALSTPVMRWQGPVYLRGHSDGIVLVGDLVVEKQAMVVLQNIAMNISGHFDQTPPRPMFDRGYQFFILNSAVWLLRGSKWTLGTKLIISATALEGTIRLQGEWNVTCANQPANPKNRTVTLNRVSVQGDGTVIVGQGVTVVVNETAFQAHSVQLHGSTDLLAGTAQIQGHGATTLGPIGRWSRHIGLFDGVTNVTTIGDGTVAIVQLQKFKSWCLPTCFRVEQQEMQALYGTTWKLTTIAAAYEPPQAFTPPYEQPRPPAHTATSSLLSASTQSTLQQLAASKHATPAPAPSSHGHHQPTGCPPVPFQNDGWEPVVVGCGAGLGTMTISFLVVFFIGKAVGRKHRGERMLDTF
eukprot:TRINITY_DN51262_c0_g1_i1.p1 TRINITY_DN51262_c0_g1~~TRINITY_DN51262_c0_g1_i1.p1  ORF type:complete len:449 (+),score=34.46 TRINITY_DN51262_c0_g1_i1:43-1347(+)